MNEKRASSEDIKNINSHQEIARKLRREGIAFEIEHEGMRKTVLYKCEDYELNENYPNNRTRLLSIWLEAKQIGFFEYKIDLKNKGCSISDKKTDPEFEGKGLSKIGFQLIAQDLISENIYFVRGRIKKTKKEAIFSRVNATDYLTKKPYESYTHSIKGENGHMIELITYLKPLTIKQKLENLIQGRRKIRA